MIGLIVTGVWLLVTPPASLLPIEIAVQLPQATVRSLAVAVVGRAQQVVTLYRDRGTLPATLAELDPIPEEILYRSTGPADFELRARLGDSTLVLPVSIPPRGAPAFALTQRIGFGP